MRAPSWNACTPNANAYTSLAYYSADTPATGLLALK